MIQTERLTLTPESPDLWIIKDDLGNTLGQLGFLHNKFSISLTESSKKLGIATEAAVAWLSMHKGQNIQAIMPKHAESLHFLKQLGFVAANKLMNWQGSLPDSQYQQLNRQLGIDTQKLGSPYHASACQLVECGTDVFNRPARLTPDTTQAWQEMQLAASKDGVVLQLVSAYRSPKYQAGLIQKKLDNGQKLNDILTINTAPGHSEHHTGRAIDLTAPDSEILEESFDQSEAFRWLSEHAATHGFTMSYPKNNPDGIVYEPWHWCFHNKSTS